MSDDLETLLRNGLGGDLLDEAPAVDDLAATVRRRHRRRAGLALAATMGAAAVVAASVGLASHSRWGPDDRLIAGPVPSAGSTHATPPTRRVGDITVEGVLVRRAGRDLLCLPGAMLAVLRLGQTKPPDPCSATVVLLGVPTSADRGTWVRVQGRYDGSTIRVSSVRPTRSPDISFPTQPPCPAPAGGWASADDGQSNKDGSINADFRAVERYARAHPGRVVTKMSVRPTPHVVVIVLASTDARGTARALAAAYPRAICVVPARYTLDQLHAALAAVNNVWQADPHAGMYEWGPGIDDGGQPLVSIKAVRSDDHLRQLVASQPAGLVQLDAWLPW